MRGLLQVAALSATATGSHDNGTFGTSVWRSSAPRWVSLSLIQAVTVCIRSHVSPEDVLARRYAAGEIDEREYLMRLSIVRDAKELTEQV